MQEVERSPDELLAHRGDLVGDLPAPENKKFYPALDGLRGIAVLMVFYNHYFQHPVSLRWGWAGVDLFFVLSGFLITGILYDTRNARNRFRVFYVRRALRIFPLYYFVLLVALLWAPYFRWAWHPVWYLWPIYLGNYGRFIWLHDFQANPAVLDHLVSTRHFVPMVFFLGHFWSLCVEEQFYLAWPLVVFFVKDRVRLRNICAASVVVCLVARISCVWFVPQGFLAADLLFRFTPLRVDSLLLGGFVALCLRGPEARKIERSAMPVIYAVGAALAGMEIYYLSKTGHLYSLETTAWLGTIGFTAIDFLSAAVILRTIDAGSAFFQLLGNRWLRRLGQMSYGFYVFHDIFHMAYARLLQRMFGQLRFPSLSIAALALCGTLVMAYTSFRFLETPFLRLKDRSTV